MRIAFISKACLVGTYQRKLEELAALPDIDLTAIVPPAWTDERGTLQLEREHLDGYRLIVEPIVFDGSYHLYFYPRIARQLDALRPDLIHIDEEPYNFATYHLLRIAKRLSAKTVFFAWQNLNRRYPFPFNLIERAVLRRADACIAGNHASARVWRAKGFQGPIRVIPQFGIDPEIFSPDPGEPRNAVFTMGYVGRLVREKGLDLLLHAAAKLPGEWRLEIVGSGPRRRALIQLADRLRVRERVTFHPWLPSAQLPSRYRAFDVLVLPSRSKRNWKEQFGRVLIEAMACGVPVIGSTCGELPHVVGDAGLIFPEGEVAALHARLDRLRQDAGLRRDLAARGRPHVLQHYTQKQIAAATAQVYREVMAGG
ncbi:MAG TPA: glycosyltransferase [Anaerolineae bacterium]|nr:glycosyltransferase [Anaerolineae bacterium]